MVILGSRLSLCCAKVIVRRSFAPASSARMKIAKPARGPPLHDCSKLMMVSCPRCQETWELDRASMETAGLPGVCILLHAGLPALWSSKLLREHLTMAERLALFSTCKALSAFVVQHCSGLHLQPAQQLSDDKERRGWVLGLAAGCDNVHIHVTDDTEEVLLDTPAIWQGITQITLCDVGLSRPTISRLMLSQLTRLHTIQLHVVGAHHSLHRKHLGVGRLRSIVQAGGLPALRTLGGKYSSLCKLEPILGAQITQLVLTDPDRLKGFASQWPEVESVEIVAHPPFSVLHTEQRGAQIQQELLSHQKLKHVKAPGSFLTYTRSTGSSSTPPAWDTLEITGKLREATLACIPLEAVQQLLLPAKLDFDDPQTDENEDIQAFTAAIQSLGPHSTVAFKHSTWGVCCNVKSSVDSSIPAVFIRFLPTVINCLSQKWVGLHGGLVLDMENLDEFDLQEQLASLAHIPEGMHTLLCRDWLLQPQALEEDSIPWVDVLAHIPAHVQHVLFENCDLTERSWLAVLDHPAPVGLRRVTLASDQWNMAWVPWAGDELISMQALVASKWPHVTLEVDNSHGQPIELDPDTFEPIDSDSDSDEEMPGEAADGSDHD